MIVALDAPASDLSLALPAPSKDGWSRKPEGSGEMRLSQGFRRRSPRADVEGYRRSADFTTSAFALGAVGVVLMSLASASAATPAVRDHRAKLVVRDHREGKPDVRDHRGAGSGGVTVKDSPRQRKPVDCLGSLCNVKKVCVGPACF